MSFVSLTSNLSPFLPPTPALTALGTALFFSSMAVNSYRQIGLKKVEQERIKGMNITIALNFFSINGHEGIQTLEDYRQVLDGLKAKAPLANSYLPLAREIEAASATLDEAKRVARDAALEVIGQLEEGPELASIRADLQGATTFGTLEESYKTLIQFLSDQNNPDFRRWIAPREGATPAGTLVQAQRSLDDARLRNKLFGIIDLLDHRIGESNPLIKRDLQAVRGALKGWPHYSSKILIQCQVLSDRLNSWKGEGQLFQKGEVERWSEELAQMASTFSSAQALANEIATQLGQAVDRWNPAYHHDCITSLSRLSLAVSNQASPEEIGRWLGEGQEGGGGGTLVEALATLAQANEVGQQVAKTNLWIRRDRTESSPLTALGEGQKAANDLFRNEGMNRLKLYAAGALISFANSLYLRFGVGIPIYRQSL